MSSSQRHPTQLCDNLPCSSDYGKCNFYRYNWCKSNKRLKNCKIPSSLLIARRNISLMNMEKKVIPELLLLKKTSTIKLPPLILMEAVARNPKIVEAHPSCERRQQQTELASTWPLVPQQGLHRYIKFQVIPHWLAGNTQKGRFKSN